MIFRFFPKIELIFRVFFENLNDYSCSPENRVDFCLFEDRVGFSCSSKIESIFGVFSEIELICFGNAQHYAIVAGRKRASPRPQPCSSNDAPTTGDGEAGPSLPSCTRGERRVSDQLTAVRPS